LSDHAAVLFEEGIIKVGGSASRRGTHQERRCIRGAPCRHLSHRQARG
jgi:hypothetical protein